VFLKVINFLPSLPVFFISLLFNSNNISSFCLPSQFISSGSLLRGSIWWKPAFLSPHKQQTYFVSLSICLQDLIGCHLGEMSGLRSTWPSPLHKSRSSPLPNQYSSDEDLHNWKPIPFFPSFKSTYMRVL